MPLLTTLWVSQLVFFQHHVTNVPQSAWLMSCHMTQAWLLVRLLVPSILLLLLQPKPKRQRPTSHSPASRHQYLFHYENYLRPAALGLRVKDRDNLQPPPPTSQPTSYLQHMQLVANPLCKYHIPRHHSLASLRHFYLVQIPPNSKFFFSCFL